MEYACGYLVMIYLWHGGLPRLTVFLPSLAISWIALWVLPSFFFVGVHVPYGYGLSY